MFEKIVKSGYSATGTLEIIPCSSFQKSMLMMVIANLRHES